MDKTALWVLEWLWRSNENRSPTGERYDSQKELQLEIL